MLRLHQCPDLCDLFEDIKAPSVRLLADKDADAIVSSGPPCLLIQDLVD